MKKQRKRYKVEEGQHELFREHREQSGYGREENVVVVEKASSIDRGEGRQGLQVKRQRGRWL